MDEFVTDGIVDRLLQIERRLDDMDRRLALFEGLARIETLASEQAYEPPEIVAATPPPSPVAPAAPPSPEPPPMLYDWVVPRQSKPTDEPNPAASGFVPPPTPPREKLTEAAGDDLEYKIGRIGLLWAGAVVVIIGILYLVALAAAHTTATPQVRFAGEQVLCAAFIIFGFIKRNEREQFGQLMTGIGSCGLYLSFAGGQVFKGLYSSEVAVALFVLLSLANLAYATWRSSRSFLAIGMIGGLIAAMLPMHDYNAPLDVGLHFVILIPCALIIARNKFLDMASWLWVASTLALLPIYTYTNHLWLLRVGALYADALVCAALYGFVHREESFDPKCVLPFVVISIAGIGGVAIEGVQNGSLHVLALASITALIGWFLRERTLVRNSLYGAALAVTVALAPMGYTRTEAAIAFSVLSIGLSLGSLRLAPAGLRALAYLEIALAACAYLGVWMSAPPPLHFGSEVAVLVSMMAAVITGAICAVRTGLSPEGAIAVGAALTLPMFERFGNLFLSGSAVGASLNVSIFFTTLVGFSVMYSIARWRPYVAPVVVTWVLYILAIAAYLVSAIVGDSSFPVDLTMIGCLVAVGVLQAQLTGSRLTGSEFDGAIFLSGSMVGLYVLRLSYLLFHHYSPSVSTSSSLAVGAAVWTLTGAALHRRLKMGSLLAVSGVGLATLLLIVWPMSLWVEAGVKHEAILSLAAVACILVVGDAVTKASRADGRDPVILVFGLTAGTTFTRFVFLELAKPAHFNFSNSTSFAIGALACFATALATFYWHREKAVAILAWIAAAFYLGAVVPTVAMLNVDDGGIRFESLTLGIALVVPLLLVRMTAPLTKERVLLTATPIILEWMSFTRLCLHVARIPTEYANAVVSLVWTAFAAILITLGFSYRAQYVRYWALFVFGVTLVKVFLIDLANVEAAIRVAILLFLGLCMVGAGYGYVRWKKSWKPQTGA